MPGRRVLSINLDVDLDLLHSWLVLQHDWTQCRVWPLLCWILLPRGQLGNHDLHCRLVLHDDWLVRRDWSVQRRVLLSGRVELGDSAELQLGRILSVEQLGCYELHSRLVLQRDRFVSGGWFVSARILLPAGLYESEAAVVQRWVVLSAELVVDASVSCGRSVWCVVDGMVC
jgi:hypothetical protein